MVSNKSDVVLVILAMHRVLLDGEEYHVDDTKSFLSDLSDDALMAILRGYTWDLYLKLDFPSSQDIIDSLYEDGRD